MRNGSLIMGFNFYHGEISLDFVEFKSGLSGGEIIRSVRGSSFASWDSGRCFRWTSAVCALSYLIVKHREVTFTGDINGAVLMGRKATMALSLDQALSKRPSWVYDVFGANSRGEPSATRLIQRKNSCCKLPGPVLVRLNPYQLAPSDIVIVLDGQPVTEHSSLQQLSQSLERSWNNRFLRKGKIRQDSVSDNSLAA